ncbi:MAG: hypothetical protein IT384_27590 [Deltaproteobacteria bacterium]|nr:hypothetical protein [Deltaproteobacteria bacterium]
MTATSKTGERKNLADVLLNLGLIDRGELTRAQTMSKQTGGHLLRVLVDQGWVDEDRLTRALSSALGIEAVTPATMKIHERVLGMIPAKLAVKFRALPVAIKRAGQNDFLYVALADPLDLEAIEELQRASHCLLQPLLAPPTQLDAAIVRVYGKLATESSGPIMAPMTSAGSGERKRGSVPPPPPLKPGSGQVSQSSRSSPSVGLPAPSGGLPPPLSSSRLSAPAARASRSAPGATPALASASAPVSAPASAPASAPVSAPASAPAPVAAAAPRSSAARPSAPVGLPSFPASWPPPKGGLEAPPIPASPGRAQGAPITPEMAKTELDLSVLDLDANNSLDFSAFKPQVVEPGIVAHAVAKSASDPVKGSPPRADSTGFDVQIEEAAELEQPSHPHAMELEDVVEELEEIVEPTDEHQPLQMVREVPPLVPENGTSRSAPRVVASRPEASADAELDEATSQMDMEPRVAPRVEMVPPPVPLPSGPPPGAFAGALEVPVSVEDVPSPFDTLRDAHFKAGLERTGIIPAIDWGRDSFEPPEIPLGEVSPLLAGIEDIPSSPAAVRARLESLPSPPPNAAAEPAPEPAGSKRGGTAGAKDAPPPREVERRARETEATRPVMPAPINPPRHAPIEHPLAQDLQAEPLEPPRPARTPPPESVPARSSRSTERRAVTESDRPRTANERSPAAQEVPPPPAPRPRVEAKPETENALVSSLLAGDTLTSSERAQLVLALGKLMLKKGLITKQELIGALDED